MCANPLLAQAPGQAPATPPATPEAPKLDEKEAFMIVAYMLGHQQGKGLKGAGFGGDEINTDELLKGFKEGINGKDAPFDSAKSQAAFSMLQQLLVDRKLAKNKAFLDANAKREGVKTTSSGMQYEVLKKGGDRKYVAPPNGAQDNGTKFKLHYKGTLINGDEFDTSMNPVRNPEGKPVEFGLAVVPGFAEALKMMPVGAKWKIYLPSELGYGKSPRGPGGPDSVLIFEIELFDIIAAPATPPAPAGGAGIAPQAPARPKASATTPPVRVPAQKPKKKESAE